MDYSYWSKLVLTALIALSVTSWLFSTFYIKAKRDFTSVAHNQQANIASVRKENETAHYRNFLVPLGFPLTTGLSLSLKYKIRNGNFADVWKAIMELSNDNTIKFTDGHDSFSLEQVNGMAAHILEKILNKNYKHVGIAVSPSSLPGFVISIASMIGSIKNSLKPHYLASIPRQKLEDIDVLVIGSWRDYKMLNGSEKWYKLVLVCEPMPADMSLPENVESWSEVLRGYNKSKLFEYDPQDISDDTKILAFTTSSWNATTSFTQGCLVSGIASFIQGFPSTHELSSNDTLTVAGCLGDVDLGIHFWHKALAVLLHGGSLTFVSKTSLRLREIENTTLLFCQPEDLMRLLEEINSKKWSSLQRLRFACATTLLSEGVFTCFGQSPFDSLNKLRCVFLSEHIQNTQLVSSFPKTVPKREASLGSLSKALLNTEKLNCIRAQLGARVVVELYCPYVVMGPISGTNFYDYRVLPRSVDETFLFCGAISTNLEGKLVHTDENPDLNVTKRQGMLCIRGFTIGRPVEPDRLASAMELSDRFGGGEGWMPTVGIFGLWGKDGCLYIYK